MRVAGFDTCLVCAGAVRPVAHARALRKALAIIKPLHSEGMSLTLDGFAMSQDMALAERAAAAGVWGAPQLSFDNVTWPAGALTAGSLPRVDRLDFRQPLGDAQLAELVRCEARAFALYLAVSYKPSLHAQATIHRFACLLHRQRSAHGAQPPVRKSTYHPRACVALLQELKLTSAAPEGAAQLWQHIVIDEPTSLSDWLTQEQYMGHKGGWHVYYLQLKLSVEEVLVGSHCTLTLAHSHSTLTSRHASQHSKHGQETTC